MEGRVLFNYGGMTVEFFDMLGIANRMLYETKIWHGKKQGEIWYGKLDLTVDAVKMPSVEGVVSNEISRQNAEYGICPVAFDSNAISWKFKHPFSERTGIYRRNAVGWIIKK